MRLMLHNSGESEDDSHQLQRKKSDGYLTQLQADSFIVFCVLSQRLALFTLQFLAGQWDFSTDAFKGMDPPSSLTIVDRMVRRCTAGLSRWDSLHLLHIAEHDYVLESSLAFFPLFPWLLRLLTHCWASPFIVLRLIHISTAFILTGIGLNLFFFVFSALLLYRFSLRLTQSAKVATLSVLLFSLNPASIFFSSLYTESLFFLLSLTGLQILHSHLLLDLRIFLSSIVFLFSFLTRSNGFLNVGYIAFYAGLELVAERKRPWLMADTTASQLRRVFSFGVRVVVAGALVWLASGVLACWQHNRFCVVQALPPSSIILFARSHNLTVIGDAVPWCSERSFLLPSFYSSIQSRYWDVSPFGYWQMRKLPCFMLATPAFILVMACSFHLFHRLYSQFWHAPLSYFESTGDLLPCCLHSLFLAFSALTVYNVEVFTRIVFSSSPFLYIETARWIDEVTPRARQSDLQYPVWLPFFGYFYRRNGVATLLVVYFVVYFFAGTLMHSAFLPFT